MASTYATDGKAGVDFTKRSTTPEFALGTAVVGDENTGWVYVVADVAVTAAQTPVVSATFHITAATGGDYTADTAFAADEYGWVRKTAVLV